MKIQHTCYCAFAAALFMLPASGCHSMTSMLNDATVTVRIVDDNGMPLDGVVSEIYSLSDNDRKTAVSDENGIVSRRMKNIYSDINGYFKKQGYYETSGRFWQWKEWGEVPPASTNFAIVMKRIENPVPMVHRMAEAYYLPRLEESVGFDLKAGDWVSPYGKGVVADIYMNATNRTAESGAIIFDVHIKFAGEFDGIQPFEANTSNKKELHSALIPPNIAPENNYQREILAYLRNANGSGFEKTETENRNWIFRVRTQVNDKGDIISANYGWITKDFKLGFETGKLGVIIFKYYYNPDPHSRSLESKKIADQQAKELAETMRNLDDAKKRK